MKTLRQLFDDVIRDLYNAETQFINAMPKMADAAQSRKLKSRIEDHILQTKGQIARLEEIAKICGIHPSGKYCKLAECLVEETAAHLKELEPCATLDAAIILCAQKQEHFEIACYGTLLAWARVLGLGDAHDLLESTLSEEGTADHLLSDAARQVNRDAATEPTSDLQTAS